MCRIGDACKQGMISLFSYLPEGEKLLTKTKTKRMSNKRLNFAFCSLVTKILQAGAAYAMCRLKKTMYCIE